MHTTLPASLTTKAKEKIDTYFATIISPHHTRRQPCHVLYGGVHLFREDSIAKIGNLALTSIKNHAPTAEAFGRILAIPSNLQEKVYQRVLNKLATEPVEDFRIDFEDGYGIRSDSEEDNHAHDVAKKAWAAQSQNKMSPYWGIRLKALTPLSLPRALRTFDIFMTTYLDASGGKIPEGFVITLPKIMGGEQLAIFNEILLEAEEKWQLEKGSLAIEAMVETTQAFVSPEGKMPLASWYLTSGKRLRGAHMGSYDFTASCDIVAQHQHLHAPVCLFAKHQMQMAFAGAPIWLADGASNIIPQGDTMHVGWRRCYDANLMSLTQGFYQGWDLHPHHLPVRYAALYTFFLSGYEETLARLKQFVAQKEQATLSGSTFDDAATGRGLVNFFRRAANCRALPKEDIPEELLGSTNL